MRSRSLNSIPIPVRRALKKLGADFADARKRRRISTVTMAERLMVSRPTLVKLERGDPTVSLGIVATACFVLGLLDRLSDLADASQDSLGLDMESEHLPKRIRTRKGSS